VTITTRLHRRTAARRICTDQRDDVGILILAALDGANGMVSVEGENMRGVTWVVIDRGPQRRLGHRWQTAQHRGRPGASSRNAGLASDRGKETAMKLDMTNDATYTRGAVDG
jgi:hypothetical protein